MTSVRYTQVIATPCCGAHFLGPVYASINTSAREFWTDGYKHSSLAPIDGGLSRCSCGCYYLLSQSVDIDEQKIKGVPKAIYVDSNGLKQALGQVFNKDVELVIRRRYWWDLNHTYRALYRAHRDVENAASAEEIRKKYNFVQKLWAKYVTKRPLTSSRSFTTPPFEPTVEQTENMERMIDLLISQVHCDFQELAELYRELGQFDAAQKSIDNCINNTFPVRLINKLILENNCSPMRFG